jgi:hypothetical protein
MTPTEALNELRQIAAFSDLGLSERLHAIIDALQPVALDLTGHEEVTLPEWPEPELIGIAEAMTILCLKNRESIRQRMLDGRLENIGVTGGYGKQNRPRFRRADVLALAQKEKTL